MIFKHEQQNPLRTFIETPSGVCAFLSHAPHNIAFHAGCDSRDSRDKENVLKNREALISPFSIENLAYLSQIHGSEILEAKQGGLLGDGDGILIAKSGIIGLIMVADCNPILLFDTKNKALMLLHGGRVGLQKNILPNAIMLLKEQFNTNAKDLFVYVGPSIRACCYGVQEDVFRDSNFLDFKISRENKIYLDLIAFIKSQLREANITNFTISPHCTKCDESYFSYRRDSNCGRFGLFAYLKD